MAGFPMTQHLVANVEVQLDGDTAKVRAMFYNPMGVATGKNFFCGGWYNHELVRTAEGWRSQRLVEESAWFDRMEEAFAQLSRLDRSRPVAVRPAAAACCG